MKDVIRVQGAHEHNLKGFTVEIPRNQLVVFTGLSGSGKSSLAFDTIYAEGQRRYVESLSSYARLFLGQMQKPDCDAIDGLSPTIAIDQKTASHNPRSTVGTVTEIYDYLRLLYARIGQVHCPVCGRLIEAQTLDQMLDKLLSYPPQTRFTLLGPVVRGRKGEYRRELQDFRKDGYVRVRIDGTIMELDELPDDYRLDKRKKHDLEVVVDRLILRDGIRSRLADSLELALRLGEGLAYVLVQEPHTATAAESTPEREDQPGETAAAGQPVGEELIFSQNYACPAGHGSLAEVSPRLFSFNNPLGACPNCGGLGELTEIDPDLLIADANLSLNEGAIHVAGWNFADRKSWGRGFIEALAARYDFSLDTPWRELSEKARRIILYGNGKEKLPIDTSRSKYDRGNSYKSAWEGLVPSMQRRYRETHSEEVKEAYQPYLSSHVCPVCQGDRLNPQALAVTVGDLNIAALCRLPINAAIRFLADLHFSDYEAQIAGPILREIRSRLSFLQDVGLSYLTLARSASTLSGGEAQRIRLATQIGSGLTGVCYVLDEPSIGLHQRDNARLLHSLFHLRDLGNTVLVVEHDEETIRSADSIIDIGPGAGTQGGELVAQGSVANIEAEPRSITGQYLSGARQIAIPAERRPAGEQWLTFRGCREHNLKNITVRIPIGLFTCVTGVSGSGKSSLVNGIILRHLESRLNRAHRQEGDFDSASGLEALDKVIAIDQSPIGRTPRSNPATYTGVFDAIRRLFAGTSLARARGYAPGRFSFNVRGGRCEACGGDGVKRIEMHFLPDIYVTCEVCHGRRYMKETLEVEYKGKSIADVLEMTVSEALEFFAAIPAIRNKLQTLADVGLGYIHLGQPSTQLSGGEAQRVKLATELAKRATGHTIYLLDEPTTGLHWDDVRHLVDILQRLTDNGNTVIVIEHNLDVIKCADYLIDLGPEGGDGGGAIVAEGTPEELAQSNCSYTGQFLRPILSSEKSGKVRKGQKKEGV